MLKQFEMTQKDLDRILGASKPEPYMVIGNVLPRSQQENANAAWQSLGRKMGFDHMTVEPVQGKSNLFFTAVELEVPV